MQNFKELYKELALKITTDIPAILWVDLWHNQVNFLAEELQFPTPAVFLSFRMLGTEDTGQKVQQVRMQVEAYLFYETLANTYQGSWNQEDALEFLDLINSIYAKLHGSSGENYSEMRRTGFSPIDTGSSGNLYLTTFECVVVDYAAMKEYEDTTIEELEIENEVPSGENPEENIFIIRD